MNVSYIDIMQYSNNASTSCMTNGFLSDRCLYNTLCNPMMSYFHNYIICFLIVGIVVVILGLLINRYIHKLPFKFCKEQNAYIKIERDLMFYYISGCIMFFIVMLYYISY